MYVITIIYLSSKAVMKIMRLMSQVFNSKKTTRNIVYFFTYNDIKKKMLECINFKYVWLFFFLKKNLEK